MQVGQRGGGAAARNLIGENGLRGFFLPRGAAAPVPRLLHFVSHIATFYSA